MSKSKIQLIKCITIPLIVGGVAGFLTRGAMSTFQELNQPPLSPPPWLFPVVWSILYILMGVSSWLVCKSGEPTEKIDRALRIYYYQLVVNFLWPIFFFNFQWFLFSFFWLVLLGVLVCAMIRQFYRISAWAGYLNVPYLIWLVFAGYLNLGIWWLN